MKAINANNHQIAQRHGFFAATEGQILDMSLYEAIPDVDARWRAWSKVESVKRCVHQLWKSKPAPADSL
jgi:hypothetical protein